ncbi:unnamed protein product [Linum tenue]|uniref:NAC domain-containing protein n=1 Tax=Linum tenue TaxID=586396 RepID=A0AAV0KRA3_9ROSI|nr:unnamed protein product [Linum tenue]
MPFTLPPGCRFYPSDQQLLCYYLSKKNDVESDYRGDDGNGYDLIKELDLYDYEPFDLPGDSCYSYGSMGMKKHWFCYAKVRVSKGGNRGDGRRRAKGGYWRRIGKVRDVADATGNAVVGTRTRFVFYLGNSVKSALRTDWVLYEYALIDHSKASFVLCRVFVKTRGGTSVSENLLSSCAEESVSALRHIGVQCDGLGSPGITETTVPQENSDEHENDLPEHFLRQNNELEDSVTNFPGSNPRYQHLLNELVRNPGLIGGNLFPDMHPHEQLLTIMEGDYIELDDLLVDLPKETH